MKIWWLTFISVNIFNIILLTSALVITESFTVVNFLISVILSVFLAFLTEPEDMKKIRKGNNH